MVKIVLIQKNGDVIEKNVNKFSVSDMYKKCGFRKTKDFSARHTWTVDDENYVTLFAKTSGRANTENKFELPPPLDQTLFFGTIGLVKSVGPIYNPANNEMDEDADAYIEEFTVDAWNAVYDKLMGGFEDLSTSNEYESDELEKYSKDKLTKMGGYLKDGFVVDENEDDNDESDDEEEDYKGDDEMEEDSDDNLDDESIGDENEIMSTGSTEGTDETEFNFDERSSTTDSVDEYSSSNEELEGSELSEEEYLSE